MVLIAFILSVGILVGFYIFAIRVSNSEVEDRKDAYSSLQIYYKETALSNRKGRHTWTVGDSIYYKIASNIDDLGSLNADAYAQIKKYSNIDEIGRYNYLINTISQQNIPIVEELIDLLEVISEKNSSEHKILFVNAVSSLTYFQDLYYSLLIRAVQF